MGKAAKNIETEIVIEQAEHVDKVPEKYQGTFNMFVLMIAEDEDYDWLATCEDTATCGIYLKDGRDIPCLAVAQEHDEGDFAILTLDGAVEEYSADDVE